MNTATLFALLTLDMDDDELAPLHEADALKPSDEWLALMAERLEPVTSIALAA